MTLKEIAEEAGVSISTVSRVVNHKGSNAASAAVQNQIWEIVRRTGYVPNVAAQNLKRTHAYSEVPSKAIACLFARTPHALSDPFFSQLARSIEKAAYENSYVVKYTFSAIDLQDSATLQVITDNHVEGVVVLGRCDQDILKFLKQYFHYLIYTGLNAFDVGSDRVICDGYEASQAAVNYLIEMGHRNIGYIGEMHNENRYAGYCAALSANNIPIKNSHTVDMLLSSEGGYRGAKMLLTQTKSLTAIFCSNDVTAIGAMRALKEEGYRIPEDISIIGVDDIDTAQYLSPTLTTMQIPIEELGKMAAKILIDRINGGHQVPLKISLPFKIIERESCAPPKSKI